MRVLEEDQNSFGVLRLVLAAFVSVSHSWTLGGYGKEPLVALSGGVTLGYLAVCGFFGLSGALVAISVERTTPGKFLWKRARRVLPGYWTCLPITGLAFAALIGKLGNQPLASALSTPARQSASTALPAPDRTTHGPVIRAVSLRLPGHPGDRGQRAPGAAHGTSPA